MIDEYFISICLVHMVHYYLSASSSIENRFLKLDLIRSSQIGWKSFSQQLCHFLFSLWSQTAFIWTLSWHAIWIKSDANASGLKTKAGKKCPELSISISENLNLGFPVFDVSRDLKGRIRIGLYRCFLNWNPCRSDKPINTLIKYTGHHKPFSNLKNLKNFEGDYKLMKLRMPCS